MTLLTIKNPLTSGFFVCILSLWLLLTGHSAFSQVESNTVSLRKAPFEIMEVHVNANTTYRDTIRQKSYEFVKAVKQRPCEIDLSYPLFRLKTYPKANKTLNKAINGIVYGQSKVPKTLNSHQFCGDGIIGYRSNFNLSLFADQAFISLRVTTTTSLASVPATPETHTRHYDFRNNHFLRFKHFFDTGMRKQLKTMLRDSKKELNETTPVDIDQFFIKDDEVVFYQSHRLIPALKLSKKRLKAAGIWRLPKD